MIATAGSTTFHVTAKGQRTIGLPASTPTAGPERCHGDLVTSTYRDRPLSQRNVLRAFKSVLQRRELPDVPFHALRHTNATLLLLQGEHPKMVQERLGHATVAMTLDIYCAYVPSLGRAAADKLDALLA